MEISTTLHKNIFLYFLIIAICCVPITTPLMFNLAEIGPRNRNKDIVTDGYGTYISAEGIQLASPASRRTSPEAVQSQSRAGRATYAKLLHLWDSASGQLADFTTNFSFIVDSDGDTDYGDGLSFFLARNSSLVTTSGAMGLPVVVNASNTLMASAASHPFVAVEFDTYWNPNWDPVNGRDGPIGDHVGININSLVSVKAEKWWSNITSGKECVVKIQYESASQNLSVTFTGFLENTILQNQFELHYTVDLRSALPEWVLFGFSASSSGDHFQRNSVKSWFFNSTDLHVDKKRRRKNNKERRVVVITVGSLCAALVGLLLAFGLLIFLRKNNKPKDGRDQGSIGTFEPCSPRPFTFKQLSQATNNFANDRVIGVGGFGAVYRAVLSDGTSAAVKRVSNTSRQGIKEYKAEVMIISRSSHKHLVQLIGWCHEREGELLVVYELLENRSLDVHLFNSEMDPLAWDVRYKIAQGLSKALRYLHEECGGYWVLHRDIKSSNVLLDPNFNAKLSDFGLAKLFDHDKSPEISVLAGTKGYMAPECYNGHFSQQSDVYSYGVVALEIATGRKSIDLKAEEDQQVLVKWVQNLYRMDRILEAADPRLGRDYDKPQMEGLMVLGLWCVHHDFHKRPSIREIVRALNNTEDPLSDLHQKIPSLVAPILPEPMVHAYPPLFMRPHILVLHPLRYLLGTVWPQSSHDRQVSWYC